MRRRVYATVRPSVRLSVCLSHPAAACTPVRRVCCCGPGCGVRRANASSAITLDTCSVACVDCINIPLLRRIAAELSLRCSASVRLCVTSVVPARRLRCGYGLMGYTRWGTRISPRGKGEGKTGKACSQYSQRRWQGTVAVRIVATVANCYETITLRDHVKPALKQLHWLPVEQRITYKLCLFMHHIHTGQAPQYLSDCVYPSFCTQCMQIAAEVDWLSGLRSVEKNN